MTLRPLTGAFITCALKLLLTMHIFASVTKTTDGRESTWRFCQDGDKYFALRVTPQVKVVACQSVDDPVSYTHLTLPTICSV